MEYSKNSEYSLILKTVTLTFLLFTLKTDAAPNASGDKHLNVNSYEAATEVHVRSSKDYPSGDSYLEDVQEECAIAKDTTSCLKYDALKYIHELTSPYTETEVRASKRRPEFQLWGPIYLIPLLPQDISTNPPIFSELDSRSTDPESIRLFRFILRESGRFISSYGLAVNIQTDSTAGRGAADVASPKFIDDDYFNGGLNEVASRGKKKTLMYLLPLVSFFHLKALLIPILIGVLFIKKLLVLSVIFLPSLLSFVKLCKPHHHHYASWIQDHENPSDYHAEYSPHYESSGRQESEDHWMKPDGWTESNTYPAVNWRSRGNPWPEATVEQVWSFPNVSPSVVATSKEIITRNTLVPDSTTEHISPEYLYHKSNLNRRKAQHEAEERTGNIHYGLGMGHIMNKDVSSHYQEIRSNMNRDFFRKRGRDAQAEEVDPQHSKQQRSTGSLRNKFLPEIDLRSTDDNISDKKNVQEDPSVEEPQHKNNSWPEERNSIKPDSSVMKETDKNHVEPTPVDPITGEETMSGYLRLLSSGLHVQSNHAIEGKKKKKCNQENHSTVPAADTQYDADKDTSATQAHISSSYSVLRNHRLSTI